MKFLSSIPRYLLGILCGYSVPVWMTLIAVLVGVLVANWWLPSLNAKFENERIRSEYLLSNLRNLNSDVGQLVKEIGSLNRLILSESSSIEIGDQREQVLRHIADLQWRTIEFDIVIRGKQKGDFIRSFSDSLDGLRVSVERASGADDVSSVLCTLGTFLPASHRLLARLAEEANVNLTESLHLHIVEPPTRECASGL